MTMFKGVDEGNRNTAGHRLATYFFTLDKIELVEKLLLCWNETNNPPLPDIEIGEIVKAVE